MFSFFRTVVMAMLLLLFGCVHSFCPLCTGSSTLNVRQGEIYNFTDNVSVDVPRYNNQGMKSKPAPVAVAEIMTKDSSSSLTHAAKRQGNLAQGINLGTLEVSQTGGEKPVKSLAHAAERPGNLVQGVNPGTLEVLQIGGEKPVKKLEMPLKHTDVNIEVSGFVASATVTQHYHNPFEKPIEAVYTFPLPNDAAVNDMQMTIGKRTIKGLIKRKDEARKIYEQARQRGQRASLLEQERPNIFTQSVANIMPGNNIVISIRYVNILRYADGDYELVFPMVVGPRYIAGKVATGHSGTGWAPDTDAVPDASRITPPVRNPETRTGHDIALSVKLDAGVPIQHVQSPSHQINLNKINSHEYSIKLRRTDRLPNRDFLLRYQVAGTVPEIATIAHHDERGGFFTLIIQPPKKVTNEQVVPRELIFILDTSGSMRGFPLTKSKEAMEQLIQGMRPTDRFNVVRFAGDTDTLWEQPRLYTQDHANEAWDYVNGFQSRGGTEMSKGITEALSQPAANGYLRIAFLLTDGYVGNEWSIFQAIEKERRGARVFSLGVGASVNRYLLERVAEMGRGEAFYVRQDENSEKVIDQFFQRVDRPVLAHIEIDWGRHLDVTELYPTKVPDLWAGQPIRLHGRYTKGGTDTILVRGQLANLVYKQQVRVRLPQNEPAHEAMATVWARQKVRHLMNKMVRNRRTTDLIEQITQLGLTYRLMTQWTSFVATEEKSVNVDGQLQTVVQPVDLPEGVSYEGTRLGKNWERVADHSSSPQTWGCNSGGSRWCNGWNGLMNSFSGRIFDYSHQRRLLGHHRGTIEIPLMKSNSTILLSGKKVVKIAWVGGQPPYRVTVKGNGQRWKTKTNETIVEVKKKNFWFKAGKKYWITVASSVMDARTGKMIWKSITRKLTVKRTGCSQDYSQLINFEEIPSKCWLEAFQQTHRLRRKH
jgi:Ca-activated chloride channel family protein